MSKNQTLKRKQLSHLVSVEKIDHQLLGEILTIHTKNPEGFQAFDLWNSVGKTNDAMQYESVKIRLSKSTAARLAKTLTVWLKRPKKLKSKRKKP